VVVLLLMAAGAGVVSYRQWVSGGQVVPSFVGKDLAAVQSAAAAADLRVSVTGKRYDAKVPAGDVISQSVKAGSHLPGGGLVAVTLSEGAAPVPVPSLNGDTAAQAQQALKQAGLVGSQSAAQYSETVATGIVIGWNPDTGLQKLGSTVTFWVSLGPKPRIVPDLLGWSWPDAQSDLEGLRLQPVEELQYSNNVKAGYVISTTPGANVTVQRGSPVDVVVSRGPQYVVVPSDLYGMTERQARSALAQLGLPLGGTYGIGSTVIASEPTPGSRVKVGTPVFLYLF
jgi:serine/threonine-protein kinase